MAELLRAGKRILLPFGEDHRYDLVIDEDGKFLRVQCKTGRLRNGAILFNTSSVHWHRGRPAKNYKGQADFFGVYCPALHAVYLVPVEDAAVTGASLRVQPTKSGQRQGVKLAAAYRLNPAAIV